MSKSFSESYKAAGVDITAGYKAVELMKSHIARTMTKNVVSDIGGFGGLFELDMTGITRPILVSGTDGVGTKLKLAFLMDKHDTVGIDCVAMCVNDIICCGAKPLIFLDYIACGKNVPEKIAAIVAGVAEGCVQAGCALIGGETAEMPGFYPVDEYDLAGYSTGVVDRDKIVDNTKIQEGDVYDWGKSSAENCFHEHALYPTGGDLDASHPEADRALLYTQFRNAGYRLAKALEYIFEN
jgi:phosphoribosylformylglycinamidine cyclo-ligase